MTVAELITAYRVTNQTAKQREDARHAHWWEDRFRGESLAALTTVRMLRALDQLASYGRSPSTVAFYLRFLRRVCAWGVQAGYLPTDPCAGMALPKERTPAMRVLTEEEETALCAALQSPYALWVKLAIETGLKQSEQFTLRWRDVDLERATLLLPHAPTGALTTLALSPTAVDLLRQLRSLQAPSLWVFPDPQNPARTVNIHAFYVGRWVMAVQEAGIPWVAWKDLRHTCGVRLAQQGHSVQDILRAMRQREARQAYVYRAWRPDGTRLTRPTHPRRPVFTPLAEEDLRQVLTRDTTAAPLTFAEVGRLYAVNHLGDRPSRRDFESCYRQFWQPWAERPFGSVTKKEILIWLWGLQRTPERGNKALKLLRSLYNWAGRLELVTGPNPAAGLPRFSRGSRERFLSVEELQRFITGLPTLPAKPRAYLLLLLLTGARRGEALAMRWADVDMITRLWRKPRTKNGTAHVVPLPLQVMDAFQELPKSTEWVFPGTGGRSWSAASAEKMWGIIRRRWGFDDIRLHDLRRTCASYLAIDGENLPTIQGVLNHRSLGPTSIYARLNTKAVDRALQGQADRLCALQPVSTVPPSRQITAQDTTHVIEQAAIEPELEYAGTGAEWPG